MPGASVLLEMMYYKINDGKTPRRVIILGRENGGPYRGHYNAPGGKYDGKLTEKFGTITATAHTQTVRTFSIPRYERQRKR